MKKKQRKPSEGKILVLVVLLLSLDFFLLHPGVQDFRDSLLFDVLFRLVASGGILFFAWVWKKKPSRPAKWTLSVMACAVWLPMMILEYRVFLLTATVLEFLGVAVLIWEQVNLKKHTEPLLYVTVVFMLVLVTNAGSYTFVKNPNGLHFGLISVVLTMLAGCFSGYLVFSEKLKLKDDRVSERIAFVIAGFLVGFFLVWPTLLNLNYLLDTQIPQIYEMPVEDKNINTSGKNTTYHLDVSFHGELLELEVSQSQYYQFDIGDEIPVMLYEGAFHDPFYVVE